MKEGYLNSSLHEIPNSTMKLLHSKTKLIRIVDEVGCLDHMYQINNLSMKSQVYWILKVGHATDLAIVPLPDISYTTYI